MVKRFPWCHRETAAKFWFVVVGPGFWDVAFEGEGLDMGGVCEQEELRLLAYRRSLWSIESAG